MMTKLKKKIQQNLMVLYSR